MKGTKLDEKYAAPKAELNGPAPVSLRDDAALRLAGLFFLITAAFGWLQIAVSWVFGAPVEPTYVGPYVAPAIVGPAIRGALGAGLLKRRRLFVGFALAFLALEVAGLGYHAYRLLLQASWLDAIGPESGPVTHVTHTLTIFLMPGILRALPETLLLAGNPGRRRIRLAMFFFCIKFALLTIGIVSPDFLPRRFRR
jgi:hypothetical protein